jgi:L-rhamnose isomerase / sugar isomerase
MSAPTPEEEQHLTLDDLAGFTVEVPSWAYGNSGTRFKVFRTAGVPRDPYEKIADAAQVHLVTGLAPRVSLRAGDVLGAHAAFAASGYAARVAAGRVGGSQASWGA